MAPASLDGDSRYSPPTYTLNTAFFLRPRPFSFNVFSPALGVSGSVAPASSAATVCPLTEGNAEAKRTTARLAAPTVDRFMWSVLHESAQDGWRVCCRGFAVIFPPAPHLSSRRRGAEGCGALLRWCGDCPGWSGPTSRPARTRRDRCDE